MINAGLAMRSNRDSEETFTTAEAAVILTMAGSPADIGSLHTIFWILLVISLGALGATYALRKSREEVATTQ